MIDTNVVVEYGRRNDDDREDPITMMTLNRESLHAATIARDALMEREHEAERARVDYHHAIRRLHADGGSLREIAEALSMSHQRVHQIVDPGDGPPRGRGPGGPGGPGGGPGRGPGPRHPRHDGPYGPPGPGAMHRLRRRMKDLVTLERFTDGARESVLAAVESAREMGHGQVGSEHLLLGVASGAADDAAVAALTSAGVTAEAVRGAVASRLQGGADDPRRRRPFTRAARRVLERSPHEVRGAGDEHIDASHVLRALIGDDGDAAAILRELGADPVALTASLDADAPSPGTA